MPTTFANTINGNEILAKRAERDYAGNDLQTTYATKTEVSTGLASKEDSANKAQTLDPSSSTEFPSSAATANYVNSSVATATANFLGNFTLQELGLTYPATDAQIGAALDAHTWPTGVTPTNNDYTYVEIENPQTTGIDDSVERFKFNGNNWVYEYTLNNSSFTAAEKAAIDSGIDSTKVTAYDTHVADTDIHVTLSDKSTWNAKQDAISDLATIRSGASAGATAVQPGDLSTVATTGAYSDLTGTPTIPTATSDLTNDSGFITLSDVPAQVNADWNSSSGASEILNKPTIPSGTQLVPAATSADEDKVLTVDSQGVPGWASAQAPISAGDGIDITNNVVSADVAAPLAINTDDEIWLKTGRGLDTQAGLQSDELEVRLSGTGGLMYDSNDDDGLAIQLAQYSGLEVQMNNGVQEGLNVLVDGTTINKNASGELTVIGGGGGGTQADWTEDDPTASSYIENKPTPKTLTGGTNITVTENSSTITISATCQNAQADWTENDPTQPAYIQHKPTIPSGNQLVPAATSADEGKCLVVDSNGDPEWGTGGKTYTGTDGVVVDNVNDTVGLEAPVDLVGGPGIVVDNPDGNTLRVSMADSGTVLWSGSLNATGITTPLSESIYNFEMIDVYCWPNKNYTTQRAGQVSRFTVPTGTTSAFFYCRTENLESGTYYSEIIYVNVSNGTTMQLAQGHRWQDNTQTKSIDSYRGEVFKIVGVHRIANN